MSMLFILTTGGHRPNLHILDNEASCIIKQGFLNNNIKYQLVPLYLHIQNEAGGDIQSFKAHIITFLYAAEPKYPSKESGIVSYHEQPWL